MKKLITLAALAVSALSFNAAASDIKFGSLEHKGMCLLSAVGSGHMSKTQATNFLKYFVVSNENPQKATVYLRGGHGYAQGFAFAFSELQKVTSKQAYDFLYKTVECDKLFGSMSM